MTSSAHAQSLYEPYYYQTRERYQEMTDTHLKLQHEETKDVSDQLNYVPDTRLTPETNKRLAQGDYPPIPTTIPPAPPREINTMGMLTQPGIDFGLQGSHYRYAEPGAGVSLTGNKIGFTPSVTQTFGDKKQYFGTVDFRYAFGQVDYDGSGQKKDEDDNLWEIRGVVGRDFSWSENYGVSPYLGFGYRHLSNDGRGLTSSGAAGYRRESQYMYMPLGVTGRMRFDGSSRISLNMEYDQLIHGEQTSDLSDTGLGYPDVTNQQDLGYGIRGSMSYETGNWSMGPFFNYWNIKQSSDKFITVSGTTYLGNEPPNNTIEYGLQLKYRFVSF